MTPYRQRHITRFLASIVFLLQLSATGLSQQLKDTLIIVATDTLFFDSDRDQVSRIDTGFLQEWLGKGESHSIVLAGHTDSDGTSDYNLALAGRRVNNAKSAILSFIPSATFTESVHGEALPIADNSSPGGKALNRRVDIHIVKPYRLRQVSGQVTGEDGAPIKDGVVFIQHKYFRDSSEISDSGKFSVYAPDSLGARLDFASSSHFMQTTYTTVSPLEDKRLMKITLPKIELNKTYDIADMFFVGNEPILLFGSIHALRALTHTMQKSNICIVIHGHVNQPSQPPLPPGTFEYELSLNRSLTVKNHLIAQGIDSTRLHNLAHSNWDMRFPEATTEREMKLNRRVEIEIRGCDVLYDITQNMVRPK